MLFIEFGEVHATDLNPAIFKHLSGCRCGHGTSVKLFHPAAIRGSFHTGPDLVTRMSFSLTPGTSRLKELIVAVLVPLVDNEAMTPPGGGCGDKCLALLLRE